MKKFSLGLLIVSVVASSLIISSTLPPATPIHFDDNQTGTTVFFNECTGENVDVTYRCRYSFRGAINGQKMILKVQLNEQQEGIGQVSGKKYVGHINQSDNQSMHLVNGTYLYSNSVSVRMVSPGTGSNFKSNVNLRYTFNSEGQVTSMRDQAAIDCQ